MLDITVIGTVKRRQVLTRGGARPGDEIYVSGPIGAAAAGLRDADGPTPRTRPDRPNVGASTAISTRSRASAPACSSAATARPRRAWI